MEEEALRLTGRGFTKKGGAGPSKHNRIRLPRVPTQRQPVPHPDMPQQLSTKV